jgi:phosphoadenosine phosphosulfate reductase
MNRLQEYLKIVKHMNAEEIVSWALVTFSTQKIALASSFSVEDQVLTHILLNAEPNARIFTLDTGRHFQETYNVWQNSIDKFHWNYEVCFPEHTEVAELIDKSGPNLFYTSIETRKACCAVRKTHPLDKVLSTVDAWIVGLRAEQAVTRNALEPVEWDEIHGIFRISPLFNWTEKEAFSYAHKYSLPLSELYEKGFRSIGCAPCTRGIGPQDDVRAGRWWWEEPEHKECGLHNRSQRK